MTNLHSNRWSLSKKVSPNAMNASQRPHKRLSLAAPSVTHHLSRFTALYGPSTSSTNCLVKKTQTKMWAQTRQTLRQQVMQVHQLCHLKAPQRETLRERAQDSGRQKQTTIQRSCSQSYLEMISVICFQWRICGRNAALPRLWLGTICQGKMSLKLSILVCLTSEYGLSMNVLR